jgi:hypothetical protein
MMSILALARVGLEDRRARRRLAAENRHAAQSLPPEARRADQGDPRAALRIIPRRLPLSFGGYERAELK